MDPDLLADLFRLLLTAALIAVNAFFVAAEFAIVGVRRTRINELVAQGNHAARWVQRALMDPTRFIAATQLGITMAGLALGWVAEPTLGHLLLPIVRMFPAALAEEASHALSAGLSFALVTFLAVVVGELTPKAITLRNPERIALLVVQPVTWIAWLLRPGIWLLHAAASGLLRLFGVPAFSGHELAHSVEELKMLVTASAASGVVEADEEDMLQAVFDFGDTLVRQVMVPRTEMVAIAAEASLDEIAALVLRHPFTRYPVYEGDLDHVQGVIHLRDLMRARRGEGADLATARGLMREAIFIPETARIGTLLRRFRARRHHLAIVVDEYGGTAGMVTLADLLEEIVGEVNDEFDSGSEIQALPDGSYLLDGLTLIEAVNDYFQLKLGDPSYDTIAGFVLGRLGRMAKVGDTLTAEGVRLRVEALDGKRIERLSLFRLPDAGAGTPPR